MEEKRQFHEVANIFPLMQPDELSELKRDIAANGLMEPIWLHPDGSVIDGRNRYLACQDVGVIPEYRTWNGQGSLVAFVVSLNLHRRHLTASQKAAIAVDLLPHLEKERKQAQGTRSDLLNNSQNFPQNFAESSVKNGTESRQEESREEAARLTGSNRQYVSDAKRIKADAPEIFEQMLSGEMSITEAKRETGRIKPKTSQPVNIETASPFDHCQTPPYAVEPLVPYLPDSVIWEPANADGYLSGALADNGCNVVTSQIENGQNFFDYQPDKWDIQVTNPPYSVKYKWLERSYELGKPFALLLPVETLAAKSGQVLFKKHGLEIILLDSRVNFKMPDQGWGGPGPQFPVAWFTWGLDLGSQMIFASMQKVKIHE